MSYKAAACSPREDFGPEFTQYDNAKVEVHHNDFTGDGTEEVWTSFQCPPANSPGTVMAVVFGFNLGSDEPLMLGALGDDAETVGGEASASGNVLTIGGPAVNGEPVAEHHHHVRLKYTWAGSKFELDSKKMTVDSDAKNVLKDGTYYAFLTGASNDSITFDAVDWYWGEDAMEACEVDGIKNEQGEWCNDYYYRNDLKALRTIGVSDDAQITYLKAGSSDPTRTTVKMLSQLKATGAISSTETPFQFITKRDQIIAMEQVFLP